MKKYAASLLEKLQNGRDARWTACVGFDGYVDSIARLMREVSGDDGTSFDTMRSAGEYFIEKAGKSCCIELNRYSVRMGGNAPLFSMALSGLNRNIHLIACLGKPEINEVFAPLEKKIRVTSVGEPGQCTALEFSDGKIMLSENTDTRMLDYSAVAGREDIISSLACCDLLVLLNWSEMLKAQELWEGIYEHIILKTPDNAKQKVLIDLSDCSARSTQDIARLRKTIRDISTVREVLLSLNENEADVLAERIGSARGNMESMARAIRKDTGVSAVSVHTNYADCLSREQTYTEVKNIHVEHPVISTGGGDHLNAGLAYGWMQGYSDGEILTLANSLGGCYIQDGISPSRDRICRYLEDI